MIVLSTKVSIINPDFNQDLALIIRIFDQRRDHPFLPTNITTTNSKTGTVILHHMDLLLIWAREANFRLLTHKSFQTLT